MYHLVLVGKTLEKGVAKEAPYCTMRGRFMDVTIAGEVARCCYDDQRRAQDVAGVVSGALAQAAKRLGFESAEIQLVVYAREGVCPRCHGSR